ncbi:hypothetical protein NXY56_001745 [Leishmania guyanensis]
MLCRGLHFDVWNYLKTLLKGRAESAMTVVGSLAITPGQTAPASARTSAAAPLEGAGSGYGLIVTSTVMSAGLAVTKSLISCVLPEVEPY